uniref:Uncharacterized protein n=1 Tax=Marophrys sp. SRT127 TaxID=2488311 RepID=A0A455RE66_9EUKA|nr:hypothetical protein [Marophrys sp. SRT127]
MSPMPFSKNEKRNVKLYQFFGGSESVLLRCLFNISWTLPQHCQKLNQKAKLCSSASAGGRPVARGFRGLFQCVLLPAGGKTSKKTNPSCVFHIPHSFQWGIWNVEQVLKNALKFFARGAVFPFGIPKSLSACVKLLGPWGRHHSSTSSTLRRSCSCGLCSCRQRGNVNALPLIKRADGHKSIW